MASRLEMEGVEAVIPLTVAAGGRVSGLSEYVGRRVIVVVPAEEPEPPLPKKRKGRGG